MNRRQEVLLRLGELKENMNYSKAILLMHVIETNLSTTDLELIESELRKEINKFKK